MSDSIVDEVGRQILQEDAPDIPMVKFEYLDHTADVQIHSWGDSLPEAFEQAAMGMFEYLTTDITTVEMKCAHKVEATGHDIQSLLYNFLDGFLLLFEIDPNVICRVVKVLDFDKENFRILAEGYGETFVLGKHPQGSEVKAITYSNMQIHDDKETNDIFVIIDI